MLAFDTNRNGRIDENEFISCISKARDNAPQPQVLSPARRRDVSPAGFMDNTLSTIGQNRSALEENFDTVQLVLKVIFASMKMTPASLDELKDINLSILDAYWARDDSMTFRESDFIHNA